MIGRGQVLVRAVDPEGRWGWADVFDLDEESFRRYILNQISHNQTLTHFKGHQDKRPLKTTTPFRQLEARENDSLGGTHNKL